MISSLNKILNCTQDLIGVSLDRFNIAPTPQIKRLVSKVKDDINELLAILDRYR